MVVLSCTCIAAEVLYGSTHQMLQSKARDGTILVMFLLKYFSYCWIFSSAAGRNTGWGVVNMLLFGLTQEMTGLPLVLLLVLCCWRALSTQPTCTGALCYVTLEYPGEAGMLLCLDALIPATRSLEINNCMKA